MKEEQDIMATMQKMHVKFKSIIQEFFFQNDGTLEKNVFNFEQPSYEI